MCSPSPHHHTTHTTPPPHLGVEFLACNTDAQHLERMHADTCIQLGRETTQGLGCGANPDAGKDSALESKDEILEFIDGAHMAFITAGMGGRHS